MKHSVSLYSACGIVGFALASEGLGVAQRQPLFIALTNMRAKGYLSHHRQVLRPDYGSFKGVLYVLIAFRATWRGHFQPVGENPTT